MNFFMIRKVIAATVLAVLLIACSDEAGQQPDVFSHTSTTTKANSDTLTKLEGCHTMIYNRDTAHLILSVKDTIVTGQLEYKRFEKDYNNGIVKGVLANDVIIADYVFQSEGTESIREVVFYVKGDSLYEGFGEVKVNGKITKFVDNRNLKLMPSPFVKVPCPNNK